ncbi:MAG TPA: NADH:ubiquinone reductase (Na(+)-transporting) subunit F, partial [Candidatus Hydrogenedentes bacterium]|nr:NADH:ubiquinone reductase (Na(+)-transporting) subunit F [Candidatus Hydrogenedentota bacterium]
MGGLITIVMGVVMFCGVVLSLVGVLLAAKAKLVPSGDVRILINEDAEKAITTPA